MIVVVLTDCPPKLRGDLSKWLFEINTGVYVGRVNARIREALWNRICENLKHGQATMVYPSQCEQKMEFRVHNTSWEIADFDGLKLMRRPSPADTQEGEHMTDDELRKVANEVRKGIVVGTHAAKSGHPGGSLSAADILTYLYFEEMNVRLSK